MTNDPTPEPVVPHSRRWIWILSVVVLVLVGGGIWWGASALGQAPGGAGNSTTASSGSPEAAPSEASTPDPEDSPVATETPATPAPDGTIVDAYGRETAAPIPLDDAAAPTKELAVNVTKIESVDGESTIPGEVAGPALRVTVDLTNNGSDDLDISATVVNLYYGADRIPGGPLLKPGGSPLRSDLASGATASGVYVFSVPTDQRDNVTIEVDTAIDNPVILFQGSVDNG